MGAVFGIKMVKIKTIKKIVIFLFILLFSFIILFFLYWNIGNGYVNHELKKYGKQIIEKIDNYKNINGKTPDSFIDLGLAPNEMWGGIGTEYKGIDFWYDRISDNDYDLYFGLSLGEALYYHSSTKEWE
ncbi:hypothetical protein [Treponema zioleckii]|uniref:hypothetical protein n=1 Tax=Treponema zioleckii TaxID=331680 RepID=UPI00168C0033|nr:hypothetical protein [Treponema zioleckii]